MFYLVGFFLVYEIIVLSMSITDTIFYPFLKDKEDGLLPRTVIFFCIFFSTHFICN